MCGIVAYVGKRQAYPIIIKGLERLEYRGYDSAGIALLNDGLNVYKKKGKVSDLKAYLAETNVESNIGIGHTRWATHGEPNDVNAHPHYSADLMKAGYDPQRHHRNYDVLKKELTSRGYTFESETDTEVFIKFIEDIYRNGDFSLEEAVRLALNKVVGRLCHRHHQPQTRPTS